MFSKLFKSAARKNLLEIFINNSRQKYYLRELASMIHYSPGSLQRELNSLVEDDILLAEKMGNLRFFSLNTKNPYLKDLKQYIAANPEITAKSIPEKPQAPSRKAKVTPFKASISEAAPASKPVLERRVDKELKAAVAPEPAAPSSSVPPQVPATPYAPAPAPAAAPEVPEPAPSVISPVLAPIHPPSGYPARSNPFSKPVLSKPNFEKPHFAPVDSKLDTSSDYSNDQPPASFDYTRFTPEEERQEFPHAAANEPEETPLSYQPESPIHQNHPDEPGDDIRLHIQ